MNLQGIVHDDENIQTASIQYEKYTIDSRKEKKRKI